MVANGQHDGRLRFINADDVYHIFILNSHGRVPETAVLERRYQIAVESRRFHSEPGSGWVVSVIGMLRQVATPRAEERAMVIEFYVDINASDQDSSVLSRCVL